MSEVEKMYKNAGVEKINTQYANNISYHLVGYPLFTAEKQLELIKWLASKEYGYYSYGFLMNISDGTTWLRVGISCGEDLIYDTYSSDGDTLEEAIAKILRFMWNKLTEEERKQIKEILE